MKLSSAEKIMESALLLFSEQGYNETSINEIAKNAKVSEATLFRLFNSKHELYITTLETYSTKAFFSKNDTLVKLSFSDFIEDLNIIILDCYAFFFENIHLWRIYISNAIQFKEISYLNNHIASQAYELIKMYLTEMQARNKNQVSSIETITNLVYAHIFYSVTQITILRKITDLDNSLKAELRENSSTFLSTIKNLFPYD